MNFNSKIYPFLLLLCCVSCYYDALTGEYAFDDTVAIVKNSDVTKLPTNLTAIFQKDFWGTPINSQDSHKSYRPLTTLMFHIEFTKLGFRSKGMKAVNLLLHIMNTLLLWKLVRRLNIGKSPITEVVAAVLFAVHPVHVEAVTGIVGRAELMFCLLYLLSLLLLLRTSADNHLIDTLIIIFTGIGMLFKETAITIPLTCIFLDYMRRRVYVWPKIQQLKKLRSCRNICFGVATLVFLVLRLWVQNFESPHFKPMDNPLAYHRDWLVRILSQNYLYMVNIWIMLCPQWLSFDWALGCVDLIRSIWDLRLQSVLAFYSFIVLTLLSYKNNYGVILCLGLMIIPFLPASGIIKVGFVIAERVLYVPSIGFCILVSYSFVFLLKQTKRKWLQRLLHGLLFAVLISLLLRTIQRAAEWKTEIALYASALRVCPKNAKVHYNIARLLSDNSERKKAIYFYKNAIKLYPDYEAALMNLGNLYREKGDFVMAEKYLNASINVFPQFSAAWMNLGIVYAAQGKYNKALECYRNALTFRPNYAVCHYNLGNLYLELKDYTKAMQNWQRSITLNPYQPKAWTNILTMLDNRGLYEDGLRLSEQALTYLPVDTSVLFIRATILGKLKHYVEAEIIYKRLIVMDPNNIRFQTNAAILYHRWGMLEKAVEGYQKAIKIDVNAAKTAAEHLEKLMKRLNADEKQEQGRIIGA